MCRHLKNLTGFAVAHPPCDCGCIRFEDAFEFPARFVSDEATRSLMWYASALPALGIQTEVSSPHLSNPNSSARIDAGSILNSLFQYTLD